MGKRILFLFCFLYVMQNALAQHHELSENKGEIGLLMGIASYKGDIAPDVQVFYSNYGVFFKKQLNNYVGIRLNAEMQQLASADMLSSDPYSLSRNANFAINSLEVSAMGEFYFLNYITESRNHKFTPYLGFGIGYFKNLETIQNNNTSIILPVAGVRNSKMDLTFPINLGLKYNIYRRFNLLAEATYRFTNFDDLDFLQDAYPTAISANAPLGFQGSSTGNDQFFSLKLGISYSFNTIYGMEREKPHHNKGLFNRFKRNK